jgi:hypothetical protein
MVHTIIAVNDHTFAKQWAHNLYNRIMKLDENVTVCLTAESS